jgi:hypothetical protein
MGPNGRVTPARRAAVPAAFRFPFCGLLGLDRSRSAPLFHCSAFRLNPAMPRGESMNVHLCPGLSFWAGVERGVGMEMQPVRMLDAARSRRRNVENCPISGSQSVACTEQMFQRAAVARTPALVSSFSTGGGKPMVRLDPLLNAMRFLGEPMRCRRTGTRRCLRRKSRVFTLFQIAHSANLKVSGD